MAMIHTQMVESSPFEPPTQLVLYSGRLKDELDIDLRRKKPHQLPEFLRRRDGLGGGGLGKNAISRG